MEERRRFVRLDTRLRTTYTVIPSNEIRHTITKDIGGGGICLFVEEILASGTRLEVALQLPSREEPILFTGEVAWSEQYEVIGKEQRQQSVEVGIRFIEIATQDQEAIMQHVILSMKPPQAAP